MNKFYAFCSFLARSFYKLLFKVEVVGQDQIDFSKQYVICANHLSNHDPFLLGGLMPLQAHFMAKKEIFKYKIIAFFLNAAYVFPVDREGNDIRAIKKAITLLKEGENLGLFPEGTRNRGFEPLPVKGGVAMLAIKTKTPVLPITIDSKFKWFGPIRIVYHTPLTLEAYHGVKQDAETLEKISQEIMNNIYSDMIHYKTE